MNNPSEKELNGLQDKLDELQALYDKATASQLDARKALLDYIWNQEIPLSSRWEVFLEAPLGILPTADRLPGRPLFSGDLKGAIKENYSRHQTIYWCDLEEVYADDITGETLLTDMQKTLILLEGYEAFEYDW